MNLSMEKKRHVFRIALLLFFFYGLLASRLFHVQVSTAQEFGDRLDVMSRRLRQNEGRAAFERGRRGRILDAQGRVLALGYDTYRLMVDPHAPFKPKRGEPDISLEERAALAFHVLTDLGVSVSRERFLSRATDPWFQGRNEEGLLIERRCRSRLLVSGLLPHERAYFVEVMKKNRIRNFFFETQARRGYPEQALVAEVVGFVAKTNDDDVARGRTGIEYELEGLLAGDDGVFRCEKDGLGREMDLGGRWARAPEDGRDVGLTLDLRIQTVLHEALAEVVAEHACHSATAIVLETGTGRILAIGSVPTFSPDQVRDGKVKFGETRCRPAVDSFEPGSTFKPFIVAKAIEWGLVSWSDAFDTNNGRYVFEHRGHRRSIRDSSPHGVLTVREIITKSSNIGMCRISFERMDLDRLYAAVDSYGFREKAGSLMPNEPRGWYPPRRSARVLSAGLSLPFGHEIRMSPLLLAAKFSIFGNGGVYPEPRLVDWVSDGRGGRIPNERGEKRLLPKWVADEVLGVLRETVESGTAKVLGGLSWSAAGKTGTAQVIDRSGPTGTYNSSLVALAPATAPRITVYVGLHGVHGTEYYAGATAGPAVRRIIDGTLRLLEVPPDRVTD